MGVRLTTYRAMHDDMGAALSDLFDPVVINVAGPDRASDWAPAVWLALHGDGAALVPVIDGALRWGSPSGNVAGAPADPTWIAAARRVSGGGLIEVFDKPPPPVVEPEPKPVPMAAPRTAATVAAEVRDHLARHAEAHGAADASVLVGGAVAGLALRREVEAKGEAAYG